jgi:hypothetical protein
MRRLSLLSALLSSFAFDAYGLEVPDYSSWYQVEIIVFAQRNEPPGGESWPVEEITYPDGMIRLATAGDAPGPDNLGQLKQLLEAGMVTGDEESGTAVDDFLFGDRSRFHDNPVIDYREPDGDDSVTEEETTALPPEDLEALLSPDYPRSFEVVDREERNLDRIAGSVNRSSRYRLLLHTAWRQPVSTSESWPILIQTGERYDDMYEVDGTLSISRSRYLHVDADLWFTRFTRRYEHELPMPEIVSEIDPQELRKHPELLEAERGRGNFIAVDQHRMNISRRMRRSTLHFFDNPWFGMLVQIEKFDYEPPEESEPFE